MGKLTTPSGNLTAIAAELLELCKQVDLSHNKTGLPPLGLRFSHPTDNANPATTMEDLDTYRLRDKVAGLAADIEAIASYPSHATKTNALKFYLSACLDFAARKEITDVLEGLSSVYGTEGVPLRALSERLGIDEAFVERIMRVLTSNYFYAEPSERRYINNRYSLLLRTGDEHPMWSAVQNAFGLAFPSALHLYDYVHQAKDGAYSSSIPFQRAFKTDQHFFRWVHEPQNADYKRIFNATMAQKNADTGIGVALDVPWDDLGCQTVIDVGGGNGSLVMLVMEHRRELRGIVQDHKGVVAQGRELCMRQHPEWLSSGRIQFQAHDFFTPQPIAGDGIVYLMRAVLHDWSQEDAMRILDNMRDALKNRPRSHLLVIDHMIKPLSTTKVESRAAATTRTALNHTTSTHVEQQGVALLDMQMLHLNGSSERTFAHWRDLLAAANWEVVQILPARSVKDIFEIRPRA